MIILSFGHTIEFKPEDRIFINAVENTKLGNRAWTIEPRIALGVEKPAAGFERIISFVGGKKEIIGDFVDLGLKWT